MRGELGIERQANAIRMDRSACEGMCYLVVEGPTDARFYKRLVDKTSCCLMFPYGNTGNAKQAVIDLLSLLSKGDQPFAGVLGMVDADFMRLDGELPGMDNLLLGDGHDLEGMLLQSPALMKLLEEYASPDKLAAFEKQRGCIRQVLLEICKPIGLLRWYNHREGLGLSFRALKLKNYVDRKKLILNVDKYIKQLLVNAGEGSRKDCLEADLKQRADVNGWEVCQGHDLVETLYIALCSAIGSQTLGTDGPDVMAKSLRLGYEGAWFTGTGLYGLLLDWQQDHAPWRIFAE